MITLSVCNMFMTAMPDTGVGGSNISLNNDMGTWIPPKVDKHQLLIPLITPPHHLPLAVQSGVINVDPQAERKLSGGYESVHTVSPANNSSDMTSLVLGQENLSLL